MANDEFYQIFLIYILPLVQNFIYDLSKKGIQKLTTPSEEELLEKAIRTSVYQSSNKLDQKTRESIVQTICEKYKNAQEPNIMTIVEREFTQSEIENVDAKEFASQICLKFIENVDKTPELRTRIGFEKIIEIRNKIDQLLQDNTNYHNKLNAQLTTFSEEQAQLKQVILQIHAVLTRILTPSVGVIEESRFVQDSFKDCFLNSLFLENKMPDNKKVTLKDVYIPNSFYVLDPSLDDTHTEHTDIVEFIYDFIIGGINSTKYLSKYDFNTRFIKVLFIKGLPGSGKSSLFYYFAYNKAYDSSFFCNYDFYFIKLIEIYEHFSGNLSTNNPLDDIKRYIGISKFDSDKTVIMLDGLDEICVAKDIDISAYCSNLIDAATYQNIRIIITTRLNYINIRHADNKNVLNIQLINLTPEQLNTWSERYFDVHNTFIEEKSCAEKNIDYLSKNKEEKLVDIFAVPLLFYMIVVSKIDISRVNSIGELYDAVFLELQNRNYDEAEEDWLQKPRVSKRIPQKLARQIAIEISYMMYKQNVLLIKIKSKELQAAISKATSLMPNIREDDKKNIESLFPMTFFYKESVDVVEFAHKSIMEFFTAEKIYQEAISFEGDFDAFIQAFMIDPIISNEVLDFFLYFAHKDNFAVLKDKYPNILESFKRMVYERRVFECQNASCCIEAQIIVFKIYWFFIRKVFNEKSSSINILLDYPFMRKYITCSLSVSVSDTIPFLDVDSNPYDFSGLTFASYDFISCKLTRCSFDHSGLVFTKFHSSDLSYASFEDTIISGAFDNCVMKYSKIKLHELGSGEIARVIFSRCDFYEALIHDCDISYCAFISTVCMNQTRFENVTMSKNQFVDFVEQEAYFSNITVILSTQDISHINNDQSRYSNIREYLKACVPESDNDFYNKYINAVVEEMNILIQG